MVTPLAHSTLRHQATMGSHKGRKFMFGLQWTLWCILRDRRYIRMIKWWNTKQWTPNNDHDSGFMHMIKHVFSERSVFRLTRAMLFTNSILIELCEVITKLLRIVRSKCLICIELCFGSIQPYHVLIHTHVGFVRTELSLLILKGKLKGQLGQYHCYWCPVFWRRQNIDSLGSDCVE